MFRIAIIEDENSVADTLKEYINRFFLDAKRDYIANRFDNAIKFLDQYKCEYDLVLMDINLPGLDGMSAIQKLREKDKEVKVIFVTSLAQYAIKGYEVNAFDFVIKPVNYYNFALKLNRVIEHFVEDDGHDIILKNKLGLVKLNINTIKYIEVSDHKLIFHTTNGNYEEYATLNKYLDLLKDESFSLCNRCYLVNLQYVKKITKDTVYVRDEQIQMSRRKYKDFMEDLNKYLGSGGNINV